MKINSYHLCMARSFLRQHFADKVAVEHEEVLAKAFMIVDSTSREEERERCIEDVRRVRDGYVEMEQRQPCNQASDMIRNRGRREDEPA